VLRAWVREIDDEPYGEGLALEALLARWYDHRTPLVTPTLADETIAAETGPPAWIPDETWPQDYRRAGGARRPRSDPFAGNAAGGGPRAPRARPAPRGACGAGVVGTAAWVRVRPTRSAANGASCSAAPKVASARRQATEAALARSACGAATGAVAVAHHSWDRAERSFTSTTSGESGPPW
jgi:hypothetical protein